MKGLEFLGHLTKQVAFMYRMYGMSRAHGCAGATIFRQALVTPRFEEDGAKCNARFFRKPISGAELHSVTFYYKLHSQSLSGLQRYFKRLYEIFG